jgi:hypothetical protein
MSVRDATTASVIPASTTVLSTTGTTVVMSANATGGGVGNGDSITFSAFAPPVASSGNEPATVPGYSANTNAVITMAQATGSGWGTVVAWGLYDALTSGNLRFWDWLGNFAWRPFSGSSASPCVLTSPAHGYSNSDLVVVTAKMGGTLPATAGSWAGALTVANVATDTFTAGVNSTGTGMGMVRKIQSQPIAGNITPQFAATTFQLSLA